MGVSRSLKVDRIMYANSGIGELAVRVAELNDVTFSCVGGFWYADGYDKPGAGWYSKQRAAIAYCMDYDLAFCAHTDEPTS